MICAPPSRAQLKPNPHWVKLPLFNRTNWSRFDRNVESELDVVYVKGLLERWFNKHYAHGDLNHEIRRAVCYVDWLLNHPESKA